MNVVRTHFTGNAVTGQVCELGMRATPLAPRTSSLAFADAGLIFRPQYSNKTLNIGDAFEKCRA